MERSNLANSYTTSPCAGAGAHLSASLPTATGVPLRPEPGRNLPQADPIAERAGQAGRAVPHNQGGAPGLPPVARVAAFAVARTFGEIGDWGAPEVCRFTYIRVGYSIRRSESLGNLGVWLPLNYRDQFIGAIERADSRLPVIRACRLGDWSKDDSDKILLAALAAYDAHCRNGDEQ